MSNETSAKVLRHVVLFKFKEKVSSDSINEVEQAFLYAIDRIGTVQGFEWGLNSSPEGLNKGFSHAFVLTFYDEKSRDAYLPHPEHIKFVKQIKPMIDDVLVIDYWTK